MPDREIQAMIMQAGEIRSEAQQLRLATQEFAEILRRGLVRATVQGVILTLVAVVFAVSLLGYLTSKSWTCDPLSLREHTFQYKVCDLVFPQTTQSYRFYKATANAATAQAEQTKILQDMQAVVNDVKTRLNPPNPNDLSPTGKRTCDLLRSIDPTSPDLKGCP